MYAKSLKYPVGSIPELWFLLLTHHKDEIEHMIRLVHIALNIQFIPAIASERLVCKICAKSKTCLRSRLTDEHCSQIMRVIKEGGKLRFLIFIMLLRIGEKKQHVHFLVKNGLRIFER